MIHLFQAQCRILPDLASDKGAVVDTGAQRGDVKYSSEIIASTGRNHKMIGALGHAKTLEEREQWQPRTHPAQGLERGRDGGEVKVMTVTRA